MSVGTEIFCFVSHCFVVGYFCVGLPRKQSEGAHANEGKRGNKK